MTEGVVWRLGCRRGWRREIRRALGRVERQYRPRRAEAAAGRLEVAPWRRRRIDSEDAVRGVNAVRDAR